MLPVNKCIFEPEQVMIVILIELTIELYLLLAKTTKTEVEGKRFTRSRTETSIML